MTKLDHPSHTLLRQTVDGKPVTLARLTCAKCGAQLDIPIRSGVNHTEVVATKARQAGWVYHARTAAKCVCRRCYLGPVAEDEMRATVQALADHFSHPAPKTAKEQPMQSNDSTSPRTPTPAEKMKIREFLDGNYDERLKAYVEPGTTDRTAGEMLNVPFSWVRDLREVAYGPLEGDAELMELSAELNKLAARLTKAEERFRGR